MEKKTVLYDQHVSLGGKIVPFGGYLLPVQFTDIIAEHMAVREAAGLFDVSHMGEVLLEGKDALPNLNALLTNDFTSLQPGRVRYTAMCNASGGMVDDLLVYCLSEERYMLVPNASNREAVVDLIYRHIFGEVRAKDISDDTALLALQGPKSQEILAALAGAEHLPEKYYSFKEHVMVGGVSCLVSQTGYTGELGFELYCSGKDAAQLWTALLSAGAAFGLLPCGLGARDTLRLEAGMPLYGHEMNETVSPPETGLGFAVKMEKADFLGKEGLFSRGVPAITRVGLKVTGRGIAREACAVFIGEEKIGETTSGTFCPYLKGAYAMALVDTAWSAEGTAVEIEVRGRRISGEIVPLPFYKRAK